MNRSICLLTGVLTAMLILHSGKIPVGCGMPEGGQSTHPQKISNAYGSKSSATEESKTGLDNPLVGTEWRLLERAVILL